MCYIGWGVDGSFTSGTANCTVLKLISEKTFGLKQRRRKASQRVCNGKSLYTVLRACDFIKGEKQVNGTT